MVPRMPAAWPLTSRQETGRFFSGKHNQTGRKNSKILTSGLHQQIAHPDHLTALFKVRKPHKSTQSNRLWFQYFILNHEHLREDDQIFEEDFWYRGQRLKPINRKKHLRIELIEPKEKKTSTKVLVSSEKSFKKYYFCEPRK